MERTRSRRALAAGLAAAALAGGAVAAVTWGAGGGAAAAADPPAKTAPAPNTRDLAAVASQAVDVLVADGTLQSAQGAAVKAQIEAGSVDPGQLVGSGTLSEAQMAAVKQRLDAIKRAG